MMDEKLKMKLEAANVDVVGTVRRFMGNEELFEKFLRKFPEDQTFPQIGAAFENGDETTALESAHTLKGVSGNLGMQRLFAACSETVRLLRAGQPERAKESYGELKAAYEEICGILSERW